jgi:hypothetical protein
MWRMWFRTASALRSSYLSGSGTLLATIAATMNAGELSTITRAQARYASWVTDVLVYIVVLNLFVEFVDEIVIESFWISILTAILLKLLLDALVGVEHRVGGYFRAREGLVYKVLGFVSLFSILFFGKFLILEVVNVVFGDEVDLGHFVEIAALIVAMIVVRGVMQWGYERLGESAAVQQPE